MLSKLLIGFLIIQVAIAIGVAFLWISRQGRPQPRDPQQDREEAMTWDAYLAKRDSIEKGDL